MTRAERNFPQRVLETSFGVGVFTVSRWRHVRWTGPRDPAAKPLADRTMSDRARGSKRGEEEHWGEGPRALGRRESDSARAADTQGRYRPVRFSPKLWDSRAAGEPTVGANRRSGAPVSRGHGRLFSIVRQQ